MSIKRMHIWLGGRDICYELERKSVKNINLRVRKDGTVYVSAAACVPTEDIEDFLRRKSVFVISAIDHASLSNHAVTQIADSVVITVLGFDLPVTVAQGKDAVRCENGTLVLSVTDTKDNALKRRVLDKWMAESCATAVNAVCRRVYPAFEQMGVAYPQIKLRHMTSQWGNCRPERGILTFSTRLASCPSECIEYIVTHEFCHFIHPDHSPRFHALMSELMPDWKRRRSILNSDRHYL